MPDREQFTASVAEVAKDHKEETGTLIARLKKLSAEEFLRLPRQVVERLSIAQYIAVARAIVPDLSPNSRPVLSAQPATRKFEWSTAKLYVVAVGTSLTLGLACAFAGPGLVQGLDNAPPVRSGATEAWPRCVRLTPEVDGCIYWPSQNLPWNYAATMLGMDEKTLRDNNRHIPSDLVPKGSRLIVWRYRGTLEN